MVQWNGALKWHITAQITKILSKFLKGPELPHSPPEQLMFSV